MKFKVLRGSHGKGGWCAPPAPRELGFESCGRGCTCPGASLAALSSLKRKSAPQLQEVWRHQWGPGPCPWYWPSLRRGNGLPGWRDCRKRTLSGKSCFCKPHRGRICREKGSPHPKTMSLAPMASWTHTGRASEQQNPGIIFHTTELL